MSYEWPATEDIVSLVQAHGQPKTAQLMGVPRATLQAHLEKEGVPPEQRRKVPKKLDISDALKELHDLVA